MCVILLSAILLIVILLSVVLLAVIRLNVKAPPKRIVLMALLSNIRAWTNLHNEDNSETFLSTLEVCVCARHALLALTTKQSSLKLKTRLEQL
jgi:hypothetical protein